VESPTNPTLKVIDLADIAARARRLGLRTIVDNTFATPLVQRPMKLGADLIIHSATKALGGHDDLMAGFVTGDAELVEAARDAMKTFGSCLDPHAAWLLELIGVQSDITLEEVRALLRERGIMVSVATVWSFYDRHGISFKKKRLRHRAGSARRGPGPCGLEGAPRAA
jgi:O-acetylhomoserine/O-acetylserine sulfhydrylase-like pyridoxal-dependent enzyme